MRGSNYIGGKAIFTVAIPRAQFIGNFYADRSNCNGYSWDSIAGQSDYDECTVYSLNKLKAGTTLLEVDTSETQKREQKLQAQWDKTKTCKAGDYDMNYTRHKGEKPYNNNFPCGNTCETCGTFWID